MKTELKTLKDLAEERRIHLSKSGEIEYTPTLRIIDLRREAIKWIKDFKDNPVETEPEDAVVGWIKHFFNITEEELK